MNADRASGREPGREARRPRLLDVRVWSHSELAGHAVFVRGRFPRRVWRCSRHGCGWAHDESVPAATESWHLSASEAP